jgi:hypothetical protein
MVPFGVQGVDGLQLVALADLPVVDVVRGGHLQRAGAELAVHIGIEDQRYAAIDQGYQHAPSLQMGIAFILRVHGHGGIAQDGLGRVVAMVMNSASSPGPFSEGEGESMR